MAAFLLMLRGIEPISTYFYGFAWWTYIVFLSGVNHLRGKNSLLLDNPREFLWIFLFSTPVWLFFEIYNFRLNNWEYVGIPIEMYVRWPGYLISFGTVLPGLFETETFLKNLGVPLRSVNGVRLHAGVSPLAPETEFHSNLYRGGWPFRMPRDGSRPSVP